MRQIELGADWFAGAVSVAEREDGWQPYRLPWATKPLFPPVLADGAALMCSGVRLRFATDAAEVALSFQPLPPAWATGHCFDLTLGGALLASRKVEPGVDTVTFADLPAGEKTVEIWCPQGAPVTVTALRVNDGADARPAPSTALKWVTYGSSITHCVRAHSPARTWPAIVARTRGLDLTCLGYGGQCIMEPLVALMIRDLPADLITLKLGINCIGGELSPRTLPSAALGLVKLIRERHPHTPIGFITPIAYPPHETKPNVVGYTMRRMRDDLRAVYDLLIADGDPNLTFFDGLAIFDEALLAQYSDDQCHPLADGIEVMAARFDRIVMATMLGQVGVRA